MPSHARTNTLCPLTFVSLILPLSLLSRLLLFRDELLTTATGRTSCSPHQSVLRTQPMWMVGGPGLRTLSFSPPPLGLRSWLQLRGGCFCQLERRRRRSVPLFLARVQPCCRDPGTDTRSRSPTPFSFSTHTLKNTLSNCVMLQSHVDSSFFLGPSTPPSLQALALFHTHFISLLCSFSLST